MSRIRAPEPTAEDSRFVLRGLLLLAALGALIATAISIALGSGIIGRGGGDDWETYRNHEYGYEISYPSGWMLSVFDPEPGDDFETQSVRLVKEGGGAAVLVAVDFQGGSCASYRVETRSISTSGIEGDEDVCYTRCPPSAACLEEPVFIVRYFAAVLEERSLTVLGDMRSDPDTTRRIVESFRFLD
jgi:hypothetical protein